MKARKVMLENLTVAQIIPTPTIAKSLKLSVHPVRYAERQGTRQRNATMEPMQQTCHFPGTRNRQDTADLN